MNQRFSNPLGELTFPLYLLHVPTMVSTKASGLWPDHNAQADALVVGVCMGAAHRQVVGRPSRTNTAR